MFRSLLVFFGSLLVAGGSARADGPFEGTWTAGPTRIEVSISSWGVDCGPRPQSTTVPSPGQVQVTQEGDQLVFHGRQSQRTDRCWSENRAVRRVSASYESGVWRVVCRTPENDPRAETGTYTLRSAGEDRIELTDVSRYDWQLNESRCVGTITSSQAFTRVGSGGTTRPDPTPEPTPEPACTPGEPARIRLAPSNATVEPGGQVQLRARVVDGAGCPVRSAPVTWDVVAPESRTARVANGTFTAAPTAAEAEGDFTVVARSRGLEARARVTVRTADLSDLIAKRTSGGVVQAADEGDASTESAAGLVARGGDGGGSVLWPAVGAAVALFVLVGAAVFLLRRRRPGKLPHDSAFDDSRPMTQPVAAPPRAPVASAHAPTARRVCPVCHKEYDDASVGFCPADGAQLVEASVASGQALICPTCRRGFGEGTRVCPTDGDELMPYALFVQRHRDKEAGAGERTKICPKCGDRYALTVTFCGKDGSELVLVN